MPSADEIAAAIVAACRETGASPLDVATGAERERGCPIPKSQAISRARAYAGRAIDKVFNRPTVAIERPEIARRIGVNRPSLSSFFASLDGRPLTWWSEDVFKRVINAVMDVEPAAKPARNITENIPLLGPGECAKVILEAARCPDSRQADHPEPRPAPTPAPQPAPYKRGPLPPAKGQLPPVKARATRDDSGFRPAPGTYEAELDDDRSVFDRGTIAPQLRRRQEYSPPKSRREMMEDLRRAAENTAKATPPPEE